MPQLFRYSPPLLLAVGLLLAASAASSPEQTTPVSTRSSPYMHSDTLRYTVTAGEPLLIALPDTLDGQLIRAYTTLRTPALSWLVGRAFLWNTRTQDTGWHRLRFAATPPDTLTLLVNVEAGD